MPVIKMSANSNVKVIILNFEALRTSHFILLKLTCHNLLDNQAQVKFAFKRTIMNKDTAKDEHTMVTSVLAAKFMDYCVMRHKTIFFFFLISTCTYFLFKPKLFILQVAYGNTSVMTSPQNSQNWQILN